MRSPALVDVIMAFVTKEGGTFRKRIRTRFKRLIFTFDNWAVNHKLIGSKYISKKKANTTPTIIRIKIIPGSIFILVISLKILLFFSLRLTNLFILIFPRVRADVKR